MHLILGGWEGEVGWGGAGHLFEFEWKQGGGRVGAGAYSRLGTYSNIKYVTNLVVFVQSAAAPLTVWQSHPCILRLNVK